jgi:integrase
MPRQPKGKRIISAAGAVMVASKNPNGHGSVYFEAAFRRSNGLVVKARWRATYEDRAGNRRTVSATTRTAAEAKRSAVMADLSRQPLTSSRFTRATTVEALAVWWLESVARHQVRNSTFDSYKKFTGYLVDELGSLAVVDVGPETLTAWQSGLLDRFAPFTVLNCRKVCRQAFGEAVKMGLIAANPFDLIKAPPAKRVSSGRALTADDARALVTATGQVRHGTAVTLLFVQGWRVSEVLGLAWEDLDLDAGTARIRRASGYTPSTGVTLGSTKTSGAEGIHHLAPIAIAHLRRRSVEQAAERLAAGPNWEQHTYDGQVVSPVFTTLTGGLVNRQAVTKAIERIAGLAGLDPTGLGTHAGRGTVITVMYAEGGLDLADIARHVGHADAATTAGYVRQTTGVYRAACCRAARSDTASRLAT